MQLHYMTLSLAAPEAPLLIIHLMQLHYITLHYRSRAAGAAADHAPDAAPRRQRGGARAPRVGRARPRGQQCRGGAAESARRGRVANERPRHVAQRAPALVRRETSQLGGACSRTASMCRLCRLSCLAARETNPLMSQLRWPETSWHTVQETKFVRRLNQWL